jgi:hypothetical protein
MAPIGTKRNLPTIVDESACRPNYNNIRYLLLSRSEQAGLKAQKDGSFCPELIEKSQAAQMPRSTCNTV